MANTTTKIPLPVLPDGIQRIALSFSGGGFRAASFSLGCVAYMHHLPYQQGRMLDKVKFISSASGGSITNMLLSCKLRQGQTFEEVFTEQIGLMNGCDLMDKVFEVLNSDSAWLQRPEKSRNLINAFAMVYDRDFFKEATFSSLSLAPSQPGYVVGEIAVNTTEFDNGMNFRFGTGGLIGNKYLHFNGDPASLQTAGKIKLGDILACSSCFPAGFEPLMFPYDFTHPALSTTQLNTAIFESDNYNGKETDASANNREITFGFMDGGIDDNQGIYAFLLADDRVNGHYDFYFTCDVTSNFLQKAFSYPRTAAQQVLQQTIPQLGKRVKTFRNWYIAGAFFLLLVGIILCFFAPTRAFGLILSGIGFTEVALPLVVVLLIKKEITGLIKGFFPPPAPGSPPNSWMTIFNRYKNDLLKLPLNSLLSMLLARASSVLLLAATVYLKKIRRISYDYLFSEKAGSVYQQLIDQSNTAQVRQTLDPGALWKDHIGVTTIYLLATKNDFMLRQIINNPVFANQTVSDEDATPITSILYPPSPALRSVADTATGMDTTLWFDGDQVDAHSMEAIIAAGQATMCFHLLLNIYQFGNTGNEWVQLKKDIVADWKKFQETPDWLYEKYSGQTFLTTVK